MMNCHTKGDISGFIDASATLDHRFSIREMTLSDFSDDLTDNSSTRIALIIDDTFRWWL